MGLDFIHDVLPDALQEGGVTWPTGAGNLQVQERLAEGLVPSVTASAWLRVRRLDCLPVAVSSQ